MEVKKSQHKYVIGPKGNSINEILAETGVFVEMPSSDSTSETITLRGPQDKLGHGKSYTIFFLFTKIFCNTNDDIFYLDGTIPMRVCDLMSLTFLILR